MVVRDPVAHFDAILSSCGGGGGGRHVRAARGGDGDGANDA
jgi:hypothetical protein